MRIPAPFFEIGPKAYLWGQDAVDMAICAQCAMRDTGVSVVFTPQLTDLHQVSLAAPDLYLCAQHMDALTPGRGQGSILPEAVKAAGAKCVMLNHAERPIPLSALRGAVMRAKEVGLTSIVCADSIAEAKAVAQLLPDVVVCEPSELIGTGVASDEEYVRASNEAVKSVSPGIQVLQGAGISTPDDVYRVILAGADATGSSSAVCKAKDPAQMIRDMLRAVRAAYDERNRMEKGR